LSAGEDGQVIICVEDEFAQSLLREILRRYDNMLLSTVSVVPFGDMKAVLSAKKALQTAGLKVIAVRDGDMGHNKEEQVYKLLGNLPPEKEIFRSERVQHSLLKNYGVSFQTILAAHPSLDHHDYSKACCEKAQTSREVLETDCIRAFLDDVGEDWFLDLCTDIERAVSAH
jgi:hypothetical protein